MNDQLATPDTILCIDDGVFPNSAFPVLVYSGAFANLKPEQIEKKLDDRGWCNSWRNGILDCDHYHSNTHEVLAIYEGQVTVLLGGMRTGRQITVGAGDVLLIPAGVAHNNRGASDSFKCIGAYPNGAVYNMNFGNAGERPEADQQIRVVPFPHNDPVSGDPDLLKKFWKTD